MSQNGYHPQGMQGYGQPNAQYPNTQFQQNGMSQGYPPAQGTQVPGGYGYDAYRPTAAPGYSAPSGQVQKGYTTPQVQFNTGINQGYSQENPQPVQPYQPYTSSLNAQNPPYSMPGGYNVPPQQGGTQGSFIPQTPYSPGYTSPGYQPPQQGGYPPAGYQQGYQQGYQSGYSNPYGQMGRVQPPAQEPAYNPIPLNGGGYVPQKVPVRRQPFTVRNWHLIAAGVLLIALFVFAVLVLKNTPMKILLVILAAGTAGLLWVKPLVAENKRLTYSILALALCLLTAVSFLMKKPAADTSDKGNSSGKTAAGENLPGSGEIQEINPDNASGLNARVETTPAPESKDGNLRERLVTFFTYWSGNRQDEMLPLCAPSWQSKQENPRTALFYLLQNRVPTDCLIESVSGTEADTSRRVTITTHIDRHNGRNPEKFRMTVLMTKENNEWYIDPQSLQSYETLETPDPNITPTVAPTDTPAIYSNTTLYYNSKGGEYYHYDPDCVNVSKKFKPMATFTYGELNNEPYSKLKPCNVCGAPLRP